MRPVGPSAVEWPAPFSGSDFPSFFIILMGLLEYPLVGFGLGSVLARAKGWTDRRARVGIVALISYMSGQLAAHVLLNLRMVNVQLVSSASPAVSLAAVDRLRESGDVSSLPLLQQKFFDDVEKQGSLTSDSLLDTLTQLGGAKGWHDLLESGGLGVGGSDARTWRYMRGWSVERSEIRAPHDQVAF